MKEQTIFVKRKTVNFTIIDNFIFNDNRISLKAKGLLCYFLSKPKDWEVQVNDLYKHSTDGFTSIRSGLTELILAGYLELKPIYDEKLDRFLGKRYYLYEEPLFSNGWRLLENKGKSYKSNEFLTYENPLSTNRVIKGKKKDINIIDDEDED